MEQQPSLMVRATLGAASATPFSSRIPTTLPCCPSAVPRPVSCRWGKGENGKGCSGCVTSLTGDCKAQPSAPLLLCFLLEC
jgi:hypothetical protein